LRLSLIIPCYNEAANLPLLVPRCAEVAGAGSEVEVVLVDNGSSDASAQVLAELLPAHPGCRAVRVAENRGYGFGILAGLRAARGRILAWSHADMQTDPADALRGLALFEQAATPERLFVKGRRHGRPAADQAFTMAMAAFESALLWAPLWDINAQPTMFPRSFFTAWRHPPHDFSLDLYVYYQARRAGLEVRRFPVRFAERAHGVSHWNVDWKAKLGFIRRTVDYSLRLRREMAVQGPGPEAGERP